MSSQIIPQIDAPQDHRVHRQPGWCRTFDLLIEDMESALGEAWAIWASLKVFAFFSPTEAATRELIALGARFEKTKRTCQ